VLAFTSLLSEEIVPEKEYIRLTRARPRAKFAVISAGNSSLWLGKDHLLCIDTTGYTENYKRFYFRDIQAFIIRKNDRYKWWGFFTGVLAAAFLIFAVITGALVGKAVLGILCALFLLVFIINLILGPSSSCQVQTAVQTEELPSLNRLRRARKTLARLRPLITAAQVPLAQQQTAEQILQSGPISEPALKNPVVETPQDPPKVV